MQVATKEGRAKAMEGFDMDVDWTQNPLTAQMNYSEHSFFK